MGSHSKYSASAAHRWTACPGSIALSEHAPPQPESKYATEGTDAHACLERILRGEEPQLGVPSEMFEHAQTAAEFIWSEAPEGVEVLVETKVDLSFIHPDFGGTLDAAIPEIFGTLKVIDYKYGQGVVVDPTKNEQLLVYAVGIAQRYDWEFQDVELIIVQPRARDEAPIRRWKCSIEYLKIMAKEFAAAIKAAESPDAQLSAGSHCKWCPARIICPEVSDRALAKAQAVFEPVQGMREGFVAAPKLPAPISISVPELSAVLSAVPLVKDWIEAVEEHAQHMLEKGHEIKGWKLVEKRGTRKWTEDVTSWAESKFGAAALTLPELKSPAQLEKLSGEAKEFTRKYSTSVSSGHTMVEASDPRPAIDVLGNVFIEEEKPVSENDWRKKEKKK